MGNLKDFKMNLAKEIVKRRIRKISKDHGVSEELARKWEEEKIDVWWAMGDDDLEIKENHDRLYPGGKPTLEGELAAFSLRYLLLNFFFDW